MNRKQLILGTILIAFSQLNFGVGPLIFVAYVPFLLFLESTSGWKSRLLLFGVNFLAWTLCVAKIITGSMPLVLSVLFSLPIALLNTGGLLIWDRFKGRKLSWLAFPAAMVMQEWVQVTFTPFGTWGSATNALVDQLSFLQSASIFGMAGPAFIIYLVNYGVKEFYQKRTFNLPVKVSLAIVTAALIFGTFRVQIFQNEEQELFSAATIKSDCEAGGLPMPADNVRFQNHKKMIERTVKASQGGAELVVWNEASAVIYKHEEDSFLLALSNVAKANQVDIVLGIVVPFMEPDFHYENKSYTLTKEGQILNEYHKHEPVPGEPAIRGEEEIIFVNRDYGKLGTAICYDFDFTYLGRQNKGSDIVALPSSDWLGITPIHTQMAAIRAIENGYSIIRSTRFGLSAGITPMGQMTSFSSAYHKGNPITYVQLHKNSVKTVYSLIGDILVYLSILFLIMLSILKGKNN